MALDFLAERKIAEAVSRGELDDLPGAGRPLDLEEGALVPEELRLAHRILKNAGYVPSDLPVADKTGPKKLSLLKLRVENRYFSKVVRKLSR
jgi:hypothetical protein